MPTVTRWMVKTSLVYLLAALLVGLLQGAGPLLADGVLHNLARSLEPVRVHLFVVGWISLLIFGVVYWMFPKYSREKPRGYESLGWLTYILLNLGLILRVVFESANQSGGAAGWALVFSALLQWLAGLAFVVNTWVRVKEK